MGRYYIRHCQLLLVKAVITNIFQVNLFSATLSGFDDKVDFSGVEIPFLRAPFCLADRETRLCEIFLAKQLVNVSHK